MSAYNETTKELQESISSILNQTFTDFELIIVNDNPDDSSLNKTLEAFAQLDSRVIIVNNSNNIGLAMSMNKAAVMARGAYLARMDADDICLSHRLMVQYKIITEGHYDFVFSNYTFIDKDSADLTENVLEPEYYNPEEIRRLLPYKSIIHHPTVMLKKDLFESVHGYRNFPCAQDRDLWLRIWETGATFYMVDEPLLKYRIRANSISSIKSVEQHLTIDYIHKLFIERILRGTDSYSLENYNLYIGKGLMRRTVIEKRTFTEKLKEASASRSEGHRLKSYLLRLEVFLLSPLFRNSYLQQLKIRLVLNCRKGRYNSTNNK